MGYSHGESRVSIPDMADDLTTGGSFRCLPLPVVLCRTAFDGPRDLSVLQGDPHIDR